MKTEQNLEIKRVPALSPWPLVSEIMDASGINLEVRGLAQVLYQELFEAAYGEAYNINWLTGEGHLDAEGTVHHA